MVKYFISLSVLFVAISFLSMQASGQLNPNLTYGSVTDIDGNTYKTIVIGNQTWLAENLRTAKFSNGDSIPHVSGEAEWKAIWNNDKPTSQPAWCILRNTPSNNIPYGKLYNWYAVADNRNICPAGWHVPTDCEWMYLESSLGMSVADQETAGYRGTNEGGALKATTNWNSPNTGATNSSGFTGFPGGNRDSNGPYYGIGSGGYWWSSTENDSSLAWYRRLNYGLSDVFRDYSGKRPGFSVRCIRD